jgi:hypothetical protein
MYFSDVHFFVPLIVFCDNGDDDEQTSSEKATDAGIGAQESIGARPLGESASNLEPFEKKSGSGGWRRPFFSTKKGGCFGVSRSLNRLRPTLLRNFLL